nr:transposase (putative), gypsy type [Tanacetum cinerariifolium]
MDLLSFIRTADPTKVRVAKRQSVEDKPRLLEITVGRVVLLLLVAHARASNEMEASVDKLFDEGASGDGQARGEPIPTLPFVTSFVSATLEHEDKSHADSVTGLNLRTIDAPQRFVISSYSSHHSGANIAKAEVDSIVRSSAPAIATVTTMTATVDAVTTADRVKTLFPKSFEFNAEHYATLVAHLAPFQKYPEPFICLVGISRYYTLDENTYPELLGDNDEEMDLLSFIWTADPMKVRVAERQSVEDEPRLLETTVGRVVPLLLVAPARASNELEASVDKLFDEGSSGDGQGTDIQPVIATTDTIVEELALFVIFSYSSHHSGANIAKAEVDSIVRSSAPAIATVTTVTAAVDAVTTADRVPVEPSLFGVSLSSTNRTDSVLGGFSDAFGSDFLIGGIRTIVERDSDIQKVYVLQWRVTNGFGLDDNRICHEMLDEFAPLKFFASVYGMDHDKLFTEFNAELLKVRDEEIKNSKAQLLLKEAEATEAIRLRAEVFKFEATEKSLQGEVGVLRDHSATLEREKNELSVKVTDLSALVKVKEHEVTDLDAQVIAVKLQNDNLVDRLEKFQDEKMDEVNEKFDKLCANFVDMALHLEEKFYPYILTTIFGRRWLLAHGMKLAIVRFLNSAEYMYALGAAVSKAVEKGMQEELSAGITHGAKDKKLADVTAVDIIRNLLRLDDALAERKIRENIASHVLALRGVFVPLSEPLSATALEGMKEDASNQERMIADLDRDEGIALMDDERAKKKLKMLSTQEDELEVQEVVGVVTTAKLITEVVIVVSESVSAASATIVVVSAATITAAQLELLLLLPDEEKEWLSEIQKRNQLQKNLLKPNHVKHKAKEDPYVQRYQVMKKRPKTEAQALRNMIMYLKNTAGFRFDYFKGMSYDDIRPICEAKFNSNIEFLLKIKDQIEEEENRAIKSINETPAQKAAKRRKINEDVEDLKQHLEIMPDKGDEVYTEATPLDRKVLVVDYQIIHLNNKPRYKIIRADGTHQLYVSFITLLNNFDREDLESL